MCVCVCVCGRRENTRNMKSYACIFIQDMPQRDYKAKVKSSRRRSRSSSRGGINKWLNKATSEMKTPAKVMKIPKQQSVRLQAGGNRAQRVRERETEGDPAGILWLRLRNACGLKIKSPTSWSRGWHSSCATWVPQLLGQRLGLIAATEVSRCLSGACARRQQTNSAIVSALCPSRTQLGLFMRTMSMVATFVWIQISTHNLRGQQRRRRRRCRFK